MDVKTIIINLNILGQLTTGTKLNTREKYFTIDKVHLLQGLMRFSRRDDRNVTCEKISTLIGNLEQFSEKLGQNYSETDFVTEFKPIIIQAIKGLNNLKNTYETDKTFLAQIDYEINILNRVLSKMPHVEDNSEEVI